MTVNHAADVAESEGFAESTSAQAGVFDAEAAQEAAARRETRPAAPQPAEPSAQQPVAQPVEAKPQEQAPAATEEAPVAKAAEAEPFELKAQTPEPTNFDLFAKPAPAPAVENPFGSPPKVAETNSSDPFVPVATEEPKPVEAAKPVETAPVSIEPVVAEPAEIAEPVKTAAVAATPDATAVEPVKPVEVAETQTHAPVVAQAPVAVVAEPVKAAAPSAPATSKPIAVETLQPMLEQAGLVWVNTDEGKLREASAAAAREPEAVRAPRERKALPPADATPMQQVETGKQQAH
jgi:ribonuclease E